MLGGDDSLLNPALKTLVENVDVLAPGENASNELFSLDFDNLVDKPSQAGPTTNATVAYCGAA